MRQCPKCGKRFLAEHTVVCDADGAPLENVVVASERERLLGAVVGNGYQIDGVLGDGGMGVVYRARNQRDGQPYAIKVLRHEYSTDEDLVQRFQLEAEAAAAIRHPHIVGVYEFGTLPDQSRYFVMEYLHGKSLGQLLADQGKRPGTQRRRPLPEWLALHVAQQICLGLAAAHARDVVHRDMKPDNVHLVRRGDDEHFVKILDFGIAKVHGSKSARTRTGSVFGTPHYMSPEQAQGDRDIDARTDVYAVGVLLYEMVTGRVPFDADNLMGVLTAHVYHAPVPPRQTLEGGAVSEGLQSVILRALAKRRETRYATMAELHADLLCVARGEKPRALEQSEAVTSQIALPGGPPPARVPMGIALGAALEDAPVEKLTLPTGKISRARQAQVVAIAADAGLASQTATAPAATPVTAGEPMHVVPMATGRSIPPVTGSAKLARTRTPLIAGGLTLVGLCAMAGVVVVLVRHAAGAPSASQAAVRPAPIVPLVVVQPLQAAGVPAAPAAPAVVVPSPTVTLESDPPGAQVFLGRRRLGVTPLELVRPSAGASQSYSLVADGRLRVSVPVRSDTPRALQVFLPPRAGGGSRGGGGQGAGGGSRGDLLDPWAGESH